METRNASPSVVLYVCGLCDEKFDQTCDLHRHHRSRHQFVNEEIEFDNCCKLLLDQQQQDLNGIFNKPFTLECCKATIPTLCCLEQHHCYGYGGYLVDTVDFIVSLSTRNICPLLNSKTVYKTILPDEKQDNPCYVSQDKCIPEISQQKTTLFEQQSHLKYTALIPNESDWMPDSLSNFQQDLCNINSTKEVYNSFSNDKHTHSPASILDKFTVVTIATQDSLENRTCIQSGEIEHQQTPLLNGQDKTGSLENNVCFYEKSGVLLYENVTDMQSGLLDNRCIISSDVSDLGKNCDTPTENFAITGIADSSNFAVLDLSGYVGYMMTNVASGPPVENGNNNETENHIKMSSNHKNEEIVQFENMPLNQSVESIHDVTDKDKSSALDKPENSDPTQIQMAQNQFTQFKCKVCYKVFSKREQLRRHVYLVHSNNAEQCDICQKIFKNENYMRHHKKVIHGYTLVKDQECVYCKKKFSTKLLLTKHLAGCSKTESNKIHLQRKKNEMVNFAEDKKIPVDDDVLTPYVIMENIEKDKGSNILWQPVQSHDLDHQYYISSKEDNSVERSNDVLSAVPYYPTEYQSATYNRHQSDSETIIIPSDDDETKTASKSGKKEIHKLNNPGKMLILCGFKLHYRQGILHTKCTFCRKSFLAKIAFLNHIQTHSNHPDFNSKFIEQLRRYRSFMRDIYKDTIIVPTEVKSKSSVFAGFEFVRGSFRLRIICKACNVIFHRKEFIEHAVDCYGKNGLETTGEFLENLKTLKRSVPLWKVNVPKQKRKVDKMIRKLKTKQTKPKEVPVRTKNQTTSKQRLKPLKPVPGEKVQCPTCNRTVWRLI